jgi:hypothetical protein
MSAANKQIRGIRQSIRQGVVLGRKSPGTGAVEEITMGDIALAVVSSGQVVTTGGLNPQQWTAGSVGTVGPGLFLTEEVLLGGSGHAPPGTISANWQESLVAAFSAGIAITSETLTVNYQAGTLTTFGTGITLNAGTLTPNYRAGTLTTFGTGLTLASNTLTPNWQAGVVSVIGSDLAINSGTLNLSTIPAGDILGNSSTISAVPSAIAIGANLLLGAGTLSATGVQTVVAGTGLAGGTITSSGTISLGTIPAGDIMGNSGTIGATPTGVAIGANLTLAAGTLSASEVAVV